MIKLPFAIEDASEALIKRPLAIEDASEAMIKRPLALKMLARPRPFGQNPLGFKIKIEKEVYWDRVVLTLDL